MTKFLLPVLALAATLSLSHPALAEDGDTSPPIIRPAHHTLDSINQDDIYKYVDMIFSVQNRGVFHKLDGKIHKFLKPINIEFDWPLCQDVSVNFIYDFSTRSNINFNFSSGEVTGLNLSMLILGIDGIEDLRNHRFWYEWLSTHGYKGKEDLEEKIKNGIEKKYISSANYFNDYDQITFIPLLIENEVAPKGICIEILPGILFSYLANSTITAGYDHVSDLDYLYISALYDDSILPDEPEDSARPKLAKLMSDKLERTK